MPPLVSVIIPVHNGEPFIADAIDSVLAQEGSACEVIVVDNNSTDRTRAVDEQRYGSRILLANEPRPNAADARNTGIRLASATWLAFLDADDIWLPTKLNRQLEESARQPEANLIFTLGQEFHSPNLDASQLAQLPCRVESYPLLTPSSFLVKRDTFQQVGDFPSLPSGEFIAWLGWARELGLRELLVPEVLVRRRIHATNSTRNGSTVIGYPLAAKWLLDKRRQQAGHRAP